MRKKIEHFVDDKETKTRQEKPHEPVSDEDLEVMMRWYELAFYLEKIQMEGLKNHIKLLKEHLTGVLRFWNNGYKLVKKDLRFLRILI